MWANTGATAQIELENLAMPPLLSSTTNSLMQGKNGIKSLEIVENQKRGRILLD